MGGVPPTPTPDASVVVVVGVGVVGVDRCPSHQWPCVIIKGVCVRVVGWCGAAT